MAVVRALGTPVCARMSIRPKRATLQSGIVEERTKTPSQFGYGIDDPLDRDLVPGQPDRNETDFANLQWEVSKHFRMGCELTYRRTEYTLLRNNDGMGFQTQVQFKF
jgi:hypothetical protein